MADYKEFLDNLNREAYHAGEWQWTEGEFTVTRTYQYSPPGCHDSCGVLFYVKDGKLDHVEGDPLDPVSNGKLCIRCLDLEEAVNHPDRLHYPMKRAGERGENKWERISWDEAYDIIEKKIREIWETDGGNAILCDHGTGRNINWQVPYFAHTVLKTPNTNNYGFTGFACYLPRTCGAIAPLGDFPIADSSVAQQDRYASKEWEVPEVIIVWGNEPIASNADGYLGHWLVQCVQMGSKIISVDPRLTWWGVRAEYFLQIRPGTDTALANAWLNVIIKEDLYDHDFVEYWCAYFDELAESVKDCTPEWAEEITGIPAEKIIGSARLYAGAKNACTQWGLAFDQQMSAMSAGLAAIDLMAITGNIDNPGGNLLVHNAFEMNAGYASGIEALPEEWGAKKLNTRYALGHKGADFIAHADSDAILYAVETGTPYPIKMLWIQSSNPLSCPGMDAPRVYESLKKIPFIVNVDPFITPTSIAVSDILLPVAMSPERDSARTWWTPLRAMKKVCDGGEAKTDEDIIVDLGKRLNPEVYAHMTDGKDLIDWYLHFGTGIGDNVSNEEYEFGFKEGRTLYDKSFDELVEQGGYEFDPWNATYYKYKKGMLRQDGQPGFSTPSGRVELCPSTYKVWGLEDHPYHTEPLQSPISTPEAFKEYPLILTCGGRSFEFFHSEHRQLPLMRELHPYPLATINPKTAEKYGIIDGQWIWIENDRGRFKQIACIKPTVDERTVHAEHAWWYPESDPVELFGTFDSNPNNLTRAFETGQGFIGSSIKSMICKIYPCTEGDETPGERVIYKGGWNEIIPGQA